MNFLLVTINSVLVLAYASAEAYAQNSELERIQSLFVSVNLSVLMPIIGLIVSLIFLYFFYTLVGSIRDQNRAPGNIGLSQKKILYGVLTVVAITSMWGIVAFLDNIFISGTQDPNIIIVL